ncbi:hypothetical protein D3C72_1867150 [compost metagenome]
MPVSGFGPGFDLFYVHIPGNHDGGVGGYVPLAVKIAHIVCRHSVQIAHPAHHRAAVRVGLKNGGRKLLKQHGARVVFGAHAPLFLDHLDFLGEFFIRPVVVRKAVGLQLHHITQTVGRDLLVVAGVVAVGEGIFQPTQGGYPA